MQSDLSILGCLELNTDYWKYWYTLENAKTMIPAGIYDLKYEYSPAFKQNLWELKGIPKRSEIKIHSGNFYKESKGCILIGTDWQRAFAEPHLKFSSNALKEFHQSLSKWQFETLTIIIEDPCNNG